MASTDFIVNNAYQTMAYTSESKRANLVRLLFVCSASFWTGVRHGSLYRRTPAQSFASVHAVSGLTMKHKNLKFSVISSIYKYFNPGNVIGWYTCN